MSPSARHNGSANPIPFGLSLSKPCISRLADEKERQRFDKLSANGDVLTRMMIQMASFPEASAPAGATA
jgi:hypothetical protein